MPYNLFYKLLFRTRNHAKHRITRREKQQPTASRVDATDLAGKPLAYRLARRTAIWVVVASGDSWPGRGPEGTLWSDGAGCPQAS